ncbi:hypothetical protein ANN_26636 [Periplaneta americana]|uniref:Uncharacterized protein n=1 Tax=Periplaneta americana TaxID=6978 RepID=A0ABQ8RYL3_PERAM|nr:hypothetical protein ANN_26636 [Periplaneta americana]
MRTGKKELGQSGGNMSYIVFVEHTGVLREEKRKERGHSFLPNDRDFGAIKKKLKKHDRIYVPGGYKTIIQGTCKKFSIEHLAAEDIFDFKAWWPAHYEGRCLSNESYEKEVPRHSKISFAPSELMTFKYEAENKGTVVVQSYIDGILANKKGLSTSEWISSLKMTANLAAVRSVPGRSLDGTRCRHGCPEIETLAHVLGFCEQGLLLRNSRHHLVRSKVAAALRNKGWIVEEEISCQLKMGQRDE